MIMALLSLLLLQRQAAPVEVPFVLYRNQIIVQVGIQGQGPFAMLLDTGTNPSAIDLTTARKIGLKIGTKGRAVAGGGTDSNPGYETKLPAVTSNSSGPTSQ